MIEQHDTIVIGGGQAGLAMSYYLREHGREHVVLEKTRVAERWHSERWDSLNFQFPNWSLRLPGYSYTGTDPDGFAHRSDVARFIEEYARFIQAPVRNGVQVLSVHFEPVAKAFRLTTTGGVMEARRVVVATGPFQREAIPEFSAALDKGIFQIHASRYFAPAQLPLGAVLIVGSGSSGCQIAEELLSEGRKVHLCVGRHRRIPRRYRGRDLLAWLYDIGSIAVTIDTFPDGRHPPPILLTGADGGHDVDLRALAAAGVVLTGKVTMISDGIAYFDQSLEQNLVAADKSFEAFVDAVDDFVRTSGIDAPSEALHRAPTTRIDSPPFLDLQRSGVSSVVWCTGYDLDFEWLKIDVFAADGSPRHRRGITSCPGLYFLGLHWMHKYTSGTLFGVGEDALYIAEHIRGEVAGGDA